MVIPEALENILIMFGGALIFAPLLTVKKFHINIISSIILLTPLPVGLIMGLAMTANPLLLIVIFLSAVSFISFAVPFAENSSARTKNKPNTRKFLLSFLLRWLLLLVGALGIYDLLVLDARYNVIPLGILFFSMFAVFVAGFVTIAVLGILKLMKFIKSVK